MTETEKLRALLDGRGVQYEADNGRAGRTTTWADANGKEALFAEYGTSETCFLMDCLKFTAQQAVDATLGLGECELIDEGSFTPHHDFHRVVCSECGVLFWQSRGHLPRASYCPNCGRRVKGER